MLRVLVLALAALMPLSAPAVEAPGGEVIRHIRPDSDRDLRNQYYIAMLRLALEKTRLGYGDYRLEPIEEQLSQGRAVSMVAEGRGLSVIWTMTSREREEKLLPVRIPLLKGLNGFRILLIRASDQPWFEDIRSLDPLKRLQAGQGHDWPDTDILRANNLPVTVSSAYESLFRMLDEGRVDYVPRALNEPWAEVNAFDDLDLAVEQSLLLYYPTASYFFVSRDNPRLAKRLEDGLKMALADGSFDKLFREHPINSEAFDKARLLKRTTIRLDNPLLPAATPLDESFYWWLPPRAGQREQAQR
jgi:hypothetical protein